MLVTLGSRGVYFVNDEIEQLYPAQKVKAVDTTAAGDCFNGALAVALYERKNIQEAIKFAAAAAAITVTRKGAQSSLPGRSEVENYELQGVKR